MDHRPCSSVRTVQCSRFAIPPEQFRAIQGGRNRCAVPLGRRLGIAALTELLAVNGPTAAAPVGPHFAPKAKSVIFTFIEGGPSQHELFDPKPGLEC